MTTQYWPVDIAISPASCCKTFRLMMEMTQKRIYSSEPRIYLYLVSVLSHTERLKQLSG